MEFYINLVKLCIATVFGTIIFQLAVIRDTSALYALSVDTKGLVGKIFSPKQLSDIEISFRKLNIPYNTLSVMALLWFGVLLSIVTFFICKRLFPIVSISLIIACPIVFSPFWIIKYISSKEQDRLEAGLNDFFIQLKSALKINADVIEALRRIQNLVIEPFSEYTKQLLTEINTGKLPEKALESFAQKVNIKKFSFYINNVRYCQIYGGDIAYLTENTQATLHDTIKQKKKRIKEANSICAILYLLIIIDIYMYFSFINENPYYLDIMVNSLTGRAILNINFLSLWGIIGLSNIVKRFEY